MSFVLRPGWIAGQPNEATTLRQPIGLIAARVGQQMKLPPAAPGAVGFCLVFAVIAQNGDIFYGLWYPAGIVAGNLGIGLFFLPAPRTAATSPGTRQPDRFA